MTSVHKLIQDIHEDDDSPRLRAIDGGDEGTSIHAGWRAGRPVEDPEKTKRWGFITATPSEYLIHMRRGRIRRRSSGQGASCFKWPWDSVAVIPTTINRLQFTADQVTREKVGLSVTGLAVYRIVEPELTFRMLNFSFSERASEKLAEVLREMFIGATRRHVANLSVEEVMTRRKEAIATELMSELAPVLAGAGRVEDTTASGWGVVLDTVEIQNVRVLSETVFRNMQAKYRAELAMRARQAELESAREIATREAHNARAIEETRIATDAATREQRAEAESKAAEIELREQSKREALEARAGEEQRAREQAERLADLRARDELAAEEARRAEAARLEALARDERAAKAERELVEARNELARREAELQAELAMLRARKEIERKEEESAAEALLRQRQLELDRLAGQVANATARARREIENLVSDERLRMAVAERLPAIASAFAQQFGEVHLTHFGGEASDPAAMVSRGIAQVLEVARSFGLELPRGRRSSSDD